MNIVSAVFVRWTILLMGLRFGRASSVLYDRLNETDLTVENKGEKRSLSLFDPRKFLLGTLIKKATGLSEANVRGINNYGCWCGQRGGGKIVDNFDYCCKVHDFCENDLRDYDKCGRNLYNLKKKFEYDETTNTCTPASEYRTTNDEEEKKCGYSACLCDMEMVRCTVYYKNDFNTDKIGWSTTKCAITGQPKADVVVLIQDSQAISKETFRKIKKVVRRLLTLLDSDDNTDYNFALATYAQSRRMSCFGSATETIRYMDKKFRHGRRGRKNLFEHALSKMILKQFDKRRDDRKFGDTAKILVIFSDGRAEQESGDVMDTFMLEKTAKLLRVVHNIKMVGALIPNTQNTQRIQELKGIVSSPDDALDADFSASLNEMADFLAFRVKRLTKVACLVKYTVKVYTLDTYVTEEFKLTVRIKGQGGQKTTDQLLTNPTEETERNLHVIKSEFFDVDVGVIKTVEISPDRKVDGDRGWTLKEIKVTKEMETVTAVFDESFPTWPYKWKSARAMSSNQDTEV